MVALSAPHPYSHGTLKLALAIKLSDSALVVIVGVPGGGSNRHK